MSREYFEVVISTGRLVELLDGDWVAFDREGEPVDVAIPADVGPAALLVTPVTDAVKRLDGDEVVSLDREGMWAVEAIVLNKVIVRRLDDMEVTAEELLDLVPEMGYTWQVSPISSP
jgi:hypothetical protein